MEFSRVHQRARLNSKNFSLWDGRYISGFALYAQSYTAGSPSQARKVGGRRLSRKERGK